MNSNIKLSAKEVVKSFRVGSIVRSEYYENDSHVLRVITKIEEADTESGRRIWASAGEVCCCCNRAFSKPIDGVDGEWFLPA